MWSKSSLSLWLPTSSLFSSWNPCLRADQPCCGHLEPRSARLCSPHRLLTLWWRHWSGCQLSSKLWWWSWWSRWWLRRSTSPPCSLPRPTWQYPSSLPGNPAEYSIGHTWLSCGTFRGSFLGLNWSQRQFLLLLWIPHPPIAQFLWGLTVCHQGVSEEAKDFIADCLKRKPEWVFPESWHQFSVRLSHKWAFIAFVISSKHDSKVNLDLFNFFGCSFYTMPNCPMQAVVRTKLFDIIADPRENEYVAQRKALTFVDKWGNWSQDWRSFDADLSLSGKTKRVKWIFCLSFVFLGGTWGCRRPLTRFQGQMLTIHGKVDGDSKARDWRIRGWLWRLWTNCRQDSRRRILTHRQSVRLCPSALCLCARVCCTTCAMIAIIFHKHIFVRPCLTMDWTNMSRQTLYVFKVEKSSQKILQQWT